MKRWLRGMGPGLLVTAAFIGPGTVFTASGAGAMHGPALLWAVLFSICAAMVLQEMAARLGVVARQGLGESIRASLPHPVASIFAVVLVVSAISIGNAAFQYGNVTGAVTGVMGALGDQPEWNLQPWITAAVGVIAFALLATGSVRTIQIALSGLVAVMSVVFIVTALLTPTDWNAVADGFIPRVPEGSLMSVLALIGTTVVPYNLFLHASAANERWQTGDVKDSLSEARSGTFLAIGIGGLITISIMFVAAGTFELGTEVTGGELAQRMFANLGAGGRWLFALGLFSAGLTSAVTAPLAAAYAAAGIIGFSKQRKPWAFRAVWFLVLAIGTTFAIVLDANPVVGTIFAQSANGVLLPLVAIFLLWVVNRRKIMGEFVNGPMSNLLGFAVIGVATVLGCRHLVLAYGKAVEYIQDL
ncbi:MAG: Nramp family divalent metal transporter [Pirellulales bacterium]|nr:Nramp family divalent metal transporter [Pirellulales bacterium]